MWDTSVRRLLNRFSPKQQAGGSMNNVVDSMFLCKPLYDKLKSKCHPDKFTDETQKAQAEELFQELQKCRYNYEELLKVEQQINTFLQSWA